VAISGLPPERKLNHHLVAASEARVILLTRRNILRRLVSNEISLQTRQWTSDVEVHRGVVNRELKPLDVGWIKWQLEHERAAIAEHRDRLFKDRRPFIDLWYEDLYGDSRSEQTFRKVMDIFSFLELSALDAKAQSSVRMLLEPSRRRVNSHETYRRIPNVDQIERRLGSDETGWLLR
jgi:hypothetical protein